MLKQYRNLMNHGCIIPRFRDVRTVASIGIGFALEATFDRWRLTVFMCVDKCLFASRLSKYTVRRHLSKVASSAIRFPIDATVRHRWIAG